MQTTVAVPTWESEISESTMTLLSQWGRHIPGAIQYSVRRYARPGNWLQDDAGILEYLYRPELPEQQRLELKYCLTGNAWCARTGQACTACSSAAPAGACHHKTDIVDYFSFVFPASVLDTFLKSKGPAASLSEELLSFSYKTSFSRALPLCGRSRVLLEGLLQNDYKDSLENIFINAQAQMLLVYALECVGDRDLNTVQCKFLANEADRAKIVRAREVLLQHLGEPLTIRELSRKVAMNECYLKKGFKEMFGTTIFDFYQSQRMEHAKFLLYEKGLNVTEVSMLLGYSSISHFSTAFKKHTGLKPCELLLR